MDKKSFFDEMVEKYMDPEFDFRKEFLELSLITKILANAFSLICLVISPVLLVFGLIAEVIVVLIRMPKDQWIRVFRFDVYYISDKLRFAVLVNINRLLGCRSKLLCNKIHEAASYVFEDEEKIFSDTY